MAKGKFCDTNLTAVSTVQGGAWSATWPLANLKDDSNYVGAPARCEAPGSLANSKFEIVLPEPRLVSFAALLFHTMSLGAQYRLTVSTLADAAYAAPIFSTGWQYVFPSIYDGADLEWGVENWWTGTVPSSELGLYPPHRPVAFDEVLAERIRIELDDRANPAGFFDIGGCWIASGFSSAVNFERGRALSILPRDLVDEAPGGRLFAEERVPRRKLDINYEMLTDAELQRWIDAGMRARTTRTVLFMPDTDDEAALIREFFPGVFEQPPAGRFRVNGLNTTALTFKEILA